MDRIKIILTTEEEGMKFHLAELLREMVEHDEVKNYIIMEEKGVKE